MLRAAGGDRRTDRGGECAQRCAVPAHLEVSPSGGEEIFSYKSSEHPVSSLYLPSRTLKISLYETFF